MNFAESLEYLLSLGHETLTIKLGLRNTELLLDRLDHPHKSYPSVQIAGTNGKGSTAAFLDSICRTAGIKTGLFTSPHLISITERIAIDGFPLSTGDFARLSTMVRQAAEDLVHEKHLAGMPTFFEQVTAIALLAFKEAEVSLAILETGLGGRLDATTVAAAELVAITSLALDHQEYLGETIEEIASEKAAIIRPGVDAVIAPQVPTALGVILRRSEECGVRPHLIHESHATVKDFTADGRFIVTFETIEGNYENVLLGLRGRHQIVNAAVGIQLAHLLRKRGFDISKGAIAEGIGSATHSGRLQRYDSSPSILLDGAHNPSGAVALQQYLEEFVDGPLTLIFGAMRDKKLEEIVQTLVPLADKLILTRPDNPRAAELDTLVNLASGLIGEQHIFLAASADEAFARAIELTVTGGTVCATGSLYLVGEMKRIIESGQLFEITKEKRRIEYKL